MKPLADPYASGVLKPSVHGQLVAGIKTYAANANITPERIWTSLLTTDASQDEIEYVRAIRRQTHNGNYGLVFTGKDPQRDIVGAMANLAGAMVRNFVRARVMMVEELLDYMEENGSPEHTCLLIPDFHIELGPDQDVPRDQISKLVSLLINRHGSGRQTVLYISDLSDFRLAYGGMIACHIKKSYHLIDVG